MKQEYKTKRGAPVHRAVHQVGPRDIHDHRTIDIEDYLANHLPAGKNENKGRPRSGATAACRPKKNAQDESLGV